MANVLKPVYRVSSYELFDNGTTLSMNNPFELVGFCTDQAGLDAIIARQESDYWKQLILCPEMMGVTTVITR